MCDIISTLGVNKMNQTIYEIMNDFEKIIKIAHKHANPSHSKFIKKEYKFLEEAYTYYNRKYHLSYCPLSNNLKQIQGNYRQGTKYIARQFFYPISENYVRKIQKQFPMLSIKEQKILTSTCFQKIAHMENGWEINPYTQHLEETKNFCSFCDSIDLFDSDAFLHEMRQTAIGSVAMNRVLLKYQAQLIKDMNDRGFITLLLEHEKKKHHVPIVKENLCQSFLQLNTNTSDSLALFTFWLNKYIKYLVLEHQHLLPTRFEEYLFSNNYSKSYFPSLFCTVTGKEKSEYYRLLHQHIILQKKIDELYRLKDTCLNLLLKINVNKKNLYLSKNHGLILNYTNPLTNIQVSFHTNSRKLNRKYLHELPFKEEEQITQSLPSKTLKKEYKQSKFEHLI